MTFTKNYWLLEKNVRYYVCIENIKKRKSILGGDKMSGAIMSKVWNLFGMDQAEEDDFEEEDVYDYDYEEEPVEEKKSFIKRNNKVVNLPQSQSVRNQQILNNQKKYVDF